MAGRLEVAHFPADIAQALGSDCIVVIDVLRSTTVIAYALANGASAVVPVSSPQEAFQTADTLGRANAVLGGERGNARIEGFDAGNSPEEYTPVLVGGKTVVACTTNGTRTLRAVSDASDAALVVCASFANLTAVVTALATLAENSTITLLCSGQDERFSLEDFLCAGAIASALAGNVEDLSDAALAARTLYENRAGELARFVAQGEHARHLIAMGYAGDVRRCCEIDVCAVVPVYRSGRITSSMLYSPRGTGA